MAEANGEKERKGNGASPEHQSLQSVEIEGEEEGEGVEHGKEETLDALLRRFLARVLHPEDPNAPIILRIKTSYGEAAPRLREASRNSASNILLWARSGSPLRALLLISVGTIVLIALTGLLVFTAFFLAATLNAIVVSFLVSLAAAGGMFALFFISLAAIYVGALSIAVFAISTITITAMVAVFIATGWIGFFWIVLAAIRKSMNLTKQSLGMTGSVISGYSITRQAQQ